MPEIGDIVNVFKQRISGHNIVESGIATVWRDHFGTEYDHGNVSWRIERIISDRLEVVLWDLVGDQARLNSNGEEIRASIPNWSVY